MFDNLLKLVTENAGEAIVDNPAIPNENNHEAISTATSGIVDHLKQLAVNGNLTDLLKGGNLQNHPEVSNIVQKVAGSLMGKFGLDSAQAGNIAGGLIPKVMEQFASKTNDPADSSFDLQSMIGQFTGGGTDLGGILGQVKGIFGN